VRGADRAVPDRAAGVLYGAFGAAGAFADADGGEADARLPDDFDQPCTTALGVPLQPVDQVFGPADVVAGVLVGPVEVEHVDDAQLPGHGLVLQSTTQATGQAVPHGLQVRAISVMPSPVSTSDSVMSADPHSGQTCSWKMTRNAFTAHPRQGCRRG
jgi:hypothetical protein